MGNGSGLDCNQDAIADEWKDYVQPSSLSSFKIHLSEGRSLAQLPQKASSGYDSFIVRVCV